MLRVDVEKFKQMLVAGWQQVQANIAQINDLNVFPIPDGDTGTNLSVTIAGAIRAIETTEFTSFQALFSDFFNELLMSSRGNSGVIFSQIIKGFKKSLDAAAGLVHELDVKGLNACLIKASETAYLAVQDPVEGTILTLIRLLSERMVHEQVSEIEVWFTLLVSHGETIVAQTPDFLPLLKAAGVVDSGAFGLLMFLKGMCQALNQVVSAPAPTATVLTNLPVRATIEPVIKHPFQTNGYGYCCEFILELGVNIAPNQSKKKNVFDKASFHEALLQHQAQSVVLVVEGHLVKVHAHLLSPFEFLKLGQKYGEFVSVKIENMTLQCNQKRHLTTAGFVDEAVLLSEQIAILTTAPSVKMATLFQQQYGVNYCLNTEVIGNPSTKEFFDAIESLRSKYVLVLLDNHNYYLAAKAATNLINKKIKSRLIEANNIVEVLVCLLSFNPMLSLRKNVHLAKKSLKSTYTLAISRSVKQIITEKNVKINKDDYITVAHRRILLTAVEETEIVLKTVDLLLSKLKKPETIFFVYGLDKSAVFITTLVKQIEAKVQCQLLVINSDHKVYDYYIGAQ